jgi:hypothetical protein
MVVSVKLKVNTMPLNKPISVLPKQKLVRGKDLVEIARLTEAQPSNQNQAVEIGDLLNVSYTLAQARQAATSGFLIPGQTVTVTGRGTGLGDVVVRAATPTSLDAFAALQPAVAGGSPTSVLFNLATNTTSPLGGDLGFNGNRTITRSGAYQGLNVGGSTVSEFLRNFFFPSPPPQAGISVNDPIREQGANPAVTVSWNAVGPETNLTSIVVDGISQALPSAAGVPVSGTLSRTTAPNTDTSYTIVAADGVDTPATATAGVSYFPRRYWFGEELDLLTLSASGLSTYLNNLPAGSSELSGGRGMSRTLNLNNQYPYFVYAASLGSAAFSVGGFANNDFTELVFDNTNRFGFTRSYLIIRGNERKSSLYDYVLS